MNLMAKLGRVLKRNTEPIERGVPDDVTTDNYLRSLRRQRRIQLEGIEKEKLKKDIKQHQQEIIKKQLFGIKAKSILNTNKDYMKQKLKKEKYIFKETNRLIGKKKKIGKNL